MGADEECIGSMLDRANRGDMCAPTASSIRGGSEIPISDDSSAHFCGGGVRRRAYLAAMPPLISPEEALSLGRLTDRDDIEALIERAWAARVERFGDSTDMCSLVNA